MNWRDLAACKGEPTDLFFPLPGGSPHEAKAICNRCPVRQTCLDEKLAEHDDAGGVWGGTTEQERRALRKGKLWVCELPGCEGTFRRTWNNGHQRYCSRTCTQRASDLRRRRAR